MKKNHFDTIIFKRLCLNVKIAGILIFLLSANAAIKAQDTTFPIRPIDERRVKEIEEMLSAQAAGLGDPVNNRKVWDKLSKSGKYNQFIRAMKNYAFPPFNKDEYFSLSDGSAASSGVGLTMMRKRAEGLSKVTWAECLENKGNFIKMAEDGLRDILAQKSWVSPRSDYDFKNYKGLAYSVELTSSLYAHTIAQTLYMLGDKINPQLRKQAINALYVRIFNPVLNKIATRNKDKENSFLITPNNWNHVCLAGLVGAALAVIENKHERAVFISIGEYYSKNGLIGFAEDGYCTEGITYYNYGFGHYIILRESIWQATSGKIDLFSDPKVLKIAHYIPNLEIINGVFPSVSDSREGATPDSDIMIYLNKSLDLGLPAYDTLIPKVRTSDIRMGIMMAFPNSTSKVKPKKAVNKNGYAIRSSFDQTGVFISRPLPGALANIGVAFKGGNNGESHNHNDVGSFTIVQKNTIMAGDPGAIPYTADIFSPEHRYTYKTVGSFGHPVPLVANMPQKAGVQARSKTIRSDFSPDKDIITLDITSAYDVPGLKKLERTMTYDRSGSGGITFEDNSEYTKPSDFETAVSTRAEWKQTSDSTLLLTRENEKMLVTFSSPGNRLLLKSEKISEGGTPYTRIGIAIEQPVITGKIIVNYKPIY